VNLPRATVRLQLHSGFGFDDAAATVDYYASLGISHFYLSPVLTAREGSTHGYDMVDPTQISPELGGEAGLLRLVARLRAAAMGLVIDIVPNHMGVASAANRYWQDVLEWGPHSVYAHWFDIDWQVPEPHLHGKLLLPVLGEPYDNVLRTQALALRFEAQSGRLYVAYHATRLPLAAASYAGVLASQQRLAAVARAFTLQQPSMAAAQAALAAEATRPEGRRAIEQALAPYNPPAPGAMRALHSLLEQQHYRLSWWRNAAEEINWRRFFEISDLAGLRVELDDVFEATHVLIFELYARGLIDGVRIDHVDGLADPAAYCRKLRRRLADLQKCRPAPLDAAPAWMVVEKILSPGERIPPDWNIDGSTGYDFMDQAGAVLHDGQGELVLRRTWAELCNDTQGFDDHVQAAREQLLAENFAGELEALARALHQHARSAQPAGRDIALVAIRRVLTALLAGFRRYRCYSTDAGNSLADRQVLEAAASRARLRLRLPDHGLLAEVAGWLGMAGTPQGQNLPPGLQRARTRFQQLTPPLAAKALEDTVFYRYAPLLSRNEVGSCPLSAAPGLEAFHAANVQRAASLPRSLLATATHDHKRGEDARARLAVLSEIPAQWGGMLRHWMAAHKGFRTPLPQPGSEAFIAPAPADELMLYQTLLGAWPPDLLPDDLQGLAAFAARVAAWQEKALREAKQHSSWMLPQAGYESACHAFLQGLLCSEAGRPFVAQLVQLVQQITPAATANSLTQTLLRLTSPGIPDLYQGSELADFSLVDPDNRRGVDLAARRAGMALPWPVAGGWAPSLILRGKQQLIRRTLQLRQQFPGLFCGGDYLPLQVLGPQRHHVIAFARRSGDTLSVTVALRHPAQWLQADADAGWQGTRVMLPGAATAQWQDVLSDSKLVASDACLPMAQVLQASTVALLLMVPLRPSATRLPDVDGVLQ